MAAEIAEGGAAGATDAGEGVSTPMTSTNPAHVPPIPDNPVHAAEHLIGDGKVTPDQSKAASRHPFAFMAVGFSAAALLVLTVLGETVARQTQHGFDRAIMLAMREPGPGGSMVPEGPDWLRQAMIDITALGGGTVLTLFVVGAVGLLLIQRHVLTAALLAAGVASGGIAVALAKTLFGRARPDVIDHLVEVGSASFPSGHSANSAMTYITLAILLSQIVRSKAQRVYIVGLAVVLSVTVGFSRIYLGVHWPSDVLAGLSFGTLWALAWWAIGAALRRRYAGRWQGSAGGEAG